MPEDQGHREAAVHARPVALADAARGPLHRERAGDQDDGDEHRQAEAEQPLPCQLMNSVPSGGQTAARGADVEVDPEQRREEHHLAGDEQEHAQEGVSMPLAPWPLSVSEPWPCGHGVDRARSLDRALPSWPGSRWPAPWPAPWCLRSNSGPLGADGRQRVEVVDRRRAGGRPLQGVAVPRVVGARRAARAAW